MLGEDGKCEVIVKGDWSFNHAKAKQRAKGVALNIQGEPQVNQRGFMS